MIDRPLVTAQVSDLARAVAENELLPRFATPGATATMKSPGEVVTAADQAAELALAEGLRPLVGGAAVIGEEGAHADPTLLAELDRHEWAWIVDPLDGTRHFAEGTGPFGLMVALLRGGLAVGAWIYLPLTDDLATSWLGEGTFLNGRRISIPAVDVSVRPRGGLLTGFLPEPMKSRAESTTAYERTEARHHCAAQRYVDILRGREHFAAYWRTLPWDHVPGTLLVQEAGGIARRFDGSPYLAADVAGSGLLVGANEAIWADVRDVALGLESV